MPTTWYYIKGCPFPVECSAQKKRDNKKCLTWSSRSPEGVVAKVVEHLKHSDLHKKKEKVAYEAAWGCDIQTHEAETDEEYDDQEVRVAKEEEEPEPKRRRPNALEDGYSGDPLVQEIARGVSAVVDRDRNRGFVGSSADATLTVREARQ